MAIISQDDHLTAGAWATCDLIGTEDALVVHNSFCASWSKTNAIPGYSQLSIENRSVAC